MIRTLTLMAVSGFLLCVVCIAVAFGLAGGPFRIHDMVMTRDLGIEHRHHRHHVDADLTDTDQAGARTTRDFDWPGGDRLSVDVPADIVYTQGPTAKLTIAGPADAVDHLQVRDGRIYYDPMRYAGDRLKIIMTAPSVRRFDLSGSENLVVEGYSQDSLELDISGSGQVSAKGVVKSLTLDIAGSGEADLSELATRDAKIDISGSGHAKVGPKDSARIDVSGDGVVDLTVKPAKLVKDISGAGRVSQPGMPD